MVQRWIHIIIIGDYGPVSDLVGSFFVLLGIIRNPHWTQVLWSGLLGAVSTSGCPAISKSFDTSLMVYDEVTNKNMRILVVLVCALHQYSILSHSSATLRLYRLWLPSVCDSFVSCEADTCIWPSRHAAGFISESLWPLNSTLLLDLRVRNVLASCQFPIVSNSSNPKALRSF